MNQSSTMIPGASVHDRTGLLGQGSMSVGDKLKPIKSALTLGEFNGNNVPLEFFLARLKTCTKYINWSMSDQLCQLKESLTGKAMALVWQLPDSATELDLVELLKIYYGCEMQPDVIDMS